MIYHHSSHRQDLISACMYNPDWNPSSQIQCITRPDHNTQDVAAGKLDCSFWPASKHLGRCMYSKTTRSGECLDDQNTFRYILKAS